MKRGRSRYFVVGLAGGIGGIAQAIFYGFLGTKVLTHLGDAAWHVSQETPAAVRFLLFVGQALLTLGLIGLIIRYFKEITWFGALTGLAAAAGFGLWAYGLGGEWLVLPAVHLHPLVVPGLVAAGSLLFGCMLFRSQAPKLGAVLVAFLATAGLVGLFGPELSMALRLAHPIPQTAPVMLATFTALLLGGLGWSALGFSI